MVPPVPAPADDRMGDSMAGVTAGSEEAAASPPVAFGTTETTVALPTQATSVGSTATWASIAGTPPAEANNGGPGQRSPFELSLEEGVGMDGDGVSLDGAEADDSVVPQVILDACRTGDLDVLETWQRCHTALGLSPRLQDLRDVQVKSVKVTQQ